MSANKQINAAVAAYRLALRDALTEMRERSAIFKLALEIGKHWSDQEGVNAALLDELARLVGVYERKRRKR